jgi:hypothetical protein
MLKFETSTHQNRAGSGHKERSKLFLHATPVSKLCMARTGLLAAWRQRQAEAQSQRVPEGASRNDYEIVTSLTNRMPMHGWRLEHAVREFWQNTVDGCTSVFGEVKPVRSGPGRVEVLTASEADTVPVARVDYTRPDTLFISQLMVVLLPKHLQLGSFKEGQAMAAGCHGAYVLALTAVETALLWQACND